MAAAGSGRQAAAAAGGAAAPDRMHACCHPPTGAAKPQPERHVTIKLRALLQLAIPNPGGSTTLPAPATHLQLAAAACPQRPAAQGGPSAAMSERHPPQAAEGCEGRCTRAQQVAAAPGHPEPGGAGRHDCKPYQSPCSVSGLCSACKQRGGVCGCLIQWQAGQGARSGKAERSIHSRSRSSRAGWPPTSPRSATNA